jgi:hypothetical protein
MNLNNLISHKSLVVMSNYFYREANDNFLFVCGSLRASAVKKALCPTLAMRARRVGRVCGENGRALRCSIHHSNRIYRITEA